MPANTISRRGLLTSGLALAACTRRSRERDGRKHLRFSTYGARVEIAAFQLIIERYQSQHPDVEIHLEEIGFRTQTSNDVELAAGVGPDLIRVEYLDIGRYSPSGAIVDISRYVPANFGQSFSDPVWAGVQYGGRPHAFPHQTDTTAILYNKKVFRKLGIQAPQTLDAGWTWEEFIDIARTIKRKACDYAFAVNWTFGGAFRWLNFLYQNDGCLFAKDFLTPAIRSQAALETLRWTQTFFSEGLVPPSDSSKSTQQIENMFATGVVGMYFDLGPQSMGELRPPFSWGATFLPQHKQRAAELGGNAIAVTRDTQYPDIAMDFARFLTNEQNMRDFVTAAQLLPVRKSLINEKLRYPADAEVMRIFLEQSKTVPVDLARSVTVPFFHRIQITLRDELDLAFKGGQSAEATLDHIADQIERVEKTG